MNANPISLRHPLSRRLRTRLFRSPPGASVGLAAADLNGDTRLDLVTINDGTPDTMTIRLNRGNAPGGGWLGFANPTSQNAGFAITGQPVTIVTADFDRDGDTDVAFPTTQGGGVWSVSVRTNAGNGTFPFLPLDVPASSAPQLAAGDVIGDDDIDLVLLSPLYGSGGGAPFPRLGVLSNESVPQETPGVFAVVTPADGSSGNPPYPILHWQSAARVDSYRIIVATDNALNDPILEVANLTETSFTVPGGILVRSATYYWRVEAANEAGATVATPGIASFTTLCQADFNEDGVASSQDFFDFLASFFAGCP